MDQLLSSQAMEDRSALREALYPSSQVGTPNDDTRASSIDALVAPPDHPFSGARLIRLPAVLKRVGMGRTAVYGLIKEGKFPRPVKVGTASAWIDVEITHWIEQLAAHRPL